MTSQSGNESDAVRLSEDAAAMLLARASQLDAANANHVSIAELRAAARTAGIAPDAFDQALAEFRAASAIATPSKPRSRRPWVRPLVLAALLYAAFVFFSRLFVNTPPHLT
jgi:hypothetical protein